MLHGSNMWGGTLRLLKRMKGGRLRWLLQGGSPVGRRRWVRDSFQPELSRHLNIYDFVAPPLPFNFLLLNA